MALRQYGYVTAVIGDTAKIRVDRQSACGGNCGACHGCPSGAVLIEQKNDPGRPFFIGERVILVMPFRSFFSGLLQSYGTLAVSLFGGAVLGYLIGRTEGSCVLGGFLGLLIGGAVMTLLQKKRFLPVRVLREEAENSASSYFDKGKDTKHL